MVLNCHGAMVLEFKVFRVQGLKDSLVSGFQDLNYLGFIGTRYLGFLGSRVSARFKGFGFQIQGS